MPLKIIQATPGLTTTERIFHLIAEAPQGITVRELSERLNRPVSMVNLCLKVLIAHKEICFTQSTKGQHPIYRLSSSKSLSA
ncbi:MAG: winged helix-turn-helix domain-containing protein [Microcystaceae cyanobacterium]